MYYKLVALKNQGVKIYLHCFKYGSRAEAKELELLCEKVYYYKRNTSFINQLSVLPFTVKSRINNELVKNLLSNNYPILFEVLHTCFLLNDIRFKNRFKIYRHSNIEHHYYNGLAKAEKKWLKKIYLKIEADKLKQFEKNIEHANLICAVNKTDVLYFEKNYPKVKTSYLPSFHQNNDITIKTGTGNYALYHGNLSIPENYEAVEWLLEHVISKTNYKFIIAGLNPPQFLIDEIKNYDNCELKVSPTDFEMNELVAEAHIHLLYSSQDTGLKLKLLNVIFKGRFIILNDKLLQGTEITKSNNLLICNSSSDFLHAIKVLEFLAFTDAHVAERYKITSVFNNAKNAQLLIKEIFYR